MTFQQYKAQIMVITQLEKDALHVYVGVLVFLAGLWGLKRMNASVKRAGYPWFALLAVLLIALLGEWLDYREARISAEGWYYQDSLHDIIHTCALPMLFALLLRYSTLLQRPS